MNIAIIGTGLIGGSLALSARGFQTHIIGIDANQANAKEALELGLIDEIATLEEGVKMADLVVLAIPVGAAKKILPTVLDLIDPHTVVTDMGSTKAKIVAAVKDHPKRSNYVASHPIAGTENSGPSAAFDTLFQGKIGIICDKEQSAPFAVKLVEKLYRILKMQLIYMDSISHDRHIAYVSHLSHVISYTLGLTVLDIEKDESTIFDMAGSGFASTARLAKSGAQMWTPIFMQNSEHLLTAMDAYIGKLQLFRQHIANGDADQLSELITEANDIRKVLNKK